MKEHQRVWAKATGRELPPEWDVHHLNGNYDDNRPQNLVALPGEFHQQLYSVYCYNRWGTGYLESAFRFLQEMLSVLGKEQRNRNVKNIQGRIRRKGYKSRRTGEYKWVRTTLDEVRDLCLALMDIEADLRGVSLMIARLKGESKRGFASLN